MYQFQYMNEEDDNDDDEVNIGLMQYGIGSTRGMVMMVMMMMIFIWSALDSCVWKCKWQKKIPRSWLPSGMWTRRFKMQWSGPWW